MAHNKIEDLRDHLFDVIERLKDKDEPMELDRARAIAEVSGRIIDSAKVEVDYLKVVGARNSESQLFKNVTPAPKQIGS